MNPKLHSSFFSTVNFNFIGIVFVCITHKEDKQTISLISTKNRQMSLAPQKKLCINSKEKRKFLLHWKHLMCSSYAQTHCHQHQHAILNVEAHMTGKACEKNAKHNSNVHYYVKTVYQQYIKLCDSIGTRLYREKNTYFVFHTSVDNCRPICIA